MRTEVQGCCYNPSRCTTAELISRDNRWCDPPSSSSPKSSPGSTTPSIEIWSRHEASTTSSGRETASRWSPSCSTSSDNWRKFHITRWRTWVTLSGRNLGSSCSISSKCPPSTIHGSTPSAIGIIHDVHGIRATTEGQVMRYRSNVMISLRGWSEAGSSWLSIGRPNSRIRTESRFEWCIGRGCCGCFGVCWGGELRVGQVETSIKPDSRPTIRRASESSLAIVD